MAKQIVNYEELIEFSPDFIAVFNKRGQYVYINQTYESRIGLAKGDVFGKAFDEVSFVPDNMREFGHQVFPLLLSGELTGSIPTELIDKRGHTIYLNLMCQVLNKDSDEPLIMFVARDTTKERTLELEFEKDLKLARQTQMLLLSKPIIDDSIKISGFYKASNDLSGDLYKWKKINDHTFVVFIMDMMGHGIASSLLTMSINSEFISLMRQNVIRPKEVLERLNQHMFDVFAMEPDTDTIKSYFSCIYLVLDTRSQTIDYVNAGHPSFIMKTNDNIHFFESTMIPIGLFEDVAICEKTVNYMKNLELILYTDGMTEGLEIKIEELANVDFNQIHIEEWVSEQNVKEALDDLCLVHIKVD